MVIETLFDIAPDLEAVELRARQDEFAALLGVDPELLRGLRFCTECTRDNDQWTDWGLSEVDVEGLDLTHDQVLEYRDYFAACACGSCDNTGFAAGSFEFEVEDWLKLSRDSLREATASSATL